MNEESERRGLSGVLIFCKDAKIVEICRNTRRSGLKKRKKADYILLCFHRMFYNRAKGGEKMESVILFVYVFTIPLITASLVILLIYRKRIKKENEFFEKLEYFIGALLLATVLHMFLFYFNIITKMAETKHFFFVCDMICNVCVFFWLEAQQKICESRIGMVIKKLNRYFFVSYITVWGIAISPLMTEYAIMKYFNGFLILMLLADMAGCLKIGVKSEDENGIYVMYSMGITMLLLVEYVVYELGIGSNLIIENINIAIWALIGGLTLSIILWKMQNLKTEISDWETCTEEDFAPAFLSIRNEFALTERETEILTEIFEGSGNGEIAEKLFISENTVKTHIHNLLRKMGAASRVEAVGMVRSRMAEIRQLSVIECN